MEHSNQFINKFKSLVVLILFVFCNYMPASGQRHSVENVNFTIEENNIAVIFYDIEGRGRNRKYNVEIFLRQESNQSFVYKPEALLGDVGKGRFEGEKNKIVWSIDHEPLEYFKPNPFIDDYYFTVEARRRSSAGWWIFSALAGGAAYYFLIEDPLF